MDSKTYELLRVRKSLDCREVLRLTEKYPALNTGYQSILDRIRGGAIFSGLWQARLRAHASRVLNLSIEELHKESWISGFAGMLPGLPGQAFEISSLTTSDKRRMPSSI